MVSPIVEFSQAITALNKEKKYMDAIRYFRENKTNFTEKEIAGHDSLIAAMISALRHSDHIENGFKFLEQYKIEIDENTSEFVLNAYSWLLYSKLKEENIHIEKPVVETEDSDEDEISDEPRNYKGQNEKSETIIKIENVLPLLLQYNNEFVDLVFSRLFTTVLQYEKRKQNTNWEFIVEFCNLISPELLKTDCRTIEVPIKGEMKSVEIASDREYWYAYQTTALFKLERYKDCIVYSKKALESFNKFHYSNDIWFARRMALSKKRLNQTSEAIGELEKIVSKHKNWCIQKDLAEIYFETNALENSFKYGIDALNNIGDLRFKVELLFVLGEILTARKEVEMASKHYSLAHLIRVQEKWSVPPKLQAALLKIEKEVPVEKLPILKNELKKYWASKNIKSPKQPVGV